MEYRKPVQNKRNENEKSLKQLQEELEERSRQRQMQFLPIIRERNKKLQEADKAKIDEKKAKRREQIETLKGYLKEGKKWGECARLMGCSTSFLDTLRKEAQASKIWLTKRELGQIDRLKKSKRKRNTKTKTTQN